MNLILHSNIHAAEIEFTALELFFFHCKFVNGSDSTRFVLLSISGFHYGDFPLHSTSGCYRNYIKMENVKNSNLKHLFLLRLRRFISQKNWDIIMEMKTWFFSLRSIFDWDIEIKNKRIWVLRSFWLNSESTRENICISLDFRWIVTFACREKNDVSIILNYVTHTFSPNFGASFVNLIMRVSSIFPNYFPY